MNAGWNHAYYSKTGDTGAQGSYTFKLPSAQEVYILGDLYDFRMYPTNCKTSYTSGSLSLYLGSTSVGSTSFSDQLGFGYIHFDSLAAGTYTIKASIGWRSGDVKDYTVSVYAPSKVVITDSNGKTSDPANPSAVVTTPVVTTPVVTTPVVTTPVVTTPVVVTPTVTDSTVAAQLKSALAIAITQVAGNTYAKSYPTASYFY